jgi:hypothetical protein
MKSLFYPTFKFRRTYVLQALVVLGFVLVYAVLESFDIEEAVLLLPGIVGGVYFLGLRLILHHLRLSWVVLSTLIIVALVDFLIPLWFLGLGQTDWLRTVQHLPIALIIASFEIFLEEEIEFLDDRNENLANY